MSNSNLTNTPNNKEFRIKSASTEVFGMSNNIKSYFTILRQNMSIPSTSVNKTMSSRLSSFRDTTNLASDRNIIPRENNPFFQLEGKR